MRLQVKASYTHTYIGMSYCEGKQSNHSQLIHHKEQKAILFVSNQIYCKFTLKKVQVTQTKILFPQMGRLLNIHMNHFCS